MHIIKISPVSFKIVLSKDDLKRHGVENILNNPGFSSQFFADIIEETNRLYGAPFSEGAVDAEFFESKDGGGELFLCKSKRKDTTYLFRTTDSDSLFDLCVRLSKNHLPSDSRLYLDEGRYSLVLFYPETDDFLLSCMKEYGKAAEISPVQKWLLEEHARTIIEKYAVERISESAYHARKSKEMPL